MNHWFVLLVLNNSLLCRWWKTGKLEKYCCFLLKIGDPDLWYARLPAYYAKTTGKVDWAEKAWDDFLRKSARMTKK